MSHHFYCCPFNLIGGSPVTGNGAESSIMNFSRWIGWSEDLNNAEDMFV
jgi:hypothetical protein